MRRRLITVLFGAAIMFVALPGCASIDWMAQAPESSGAVSPGDVLHSVADALSEMLGVLLDGDRVHDDEDFDNGALDDSLKNRVGRDGRKAMDANEAMGMMNSGYTLVVKNVRCNSRSSTAALVKTDGSAGNACVVSGPDADALDVVVDEWNRMVAVSANRKVGSDSVTITVGVPVSSIVVKDSKITFDADLSVARASRVEIEGTHYGTIAVRSPSVNVIVRGAGDVSLEGMTRDLDIQIKGAARLDASGLESSNAAVEVEGTAICQVNALESLDGAIRGLGAITYEGNPDIVRRDVRGFGTISPR